MSKFDLAEFEKRVEQGLIRKVTKGDLVLYNYTDACTYAKAWDDYTRVARGIIFDTKTGECVARPFPKFFNLGEMPETELGNLPKRGKYRVTDKKDGSLGIIYHYNDAWHVATRGSFDSEQAQKAEEILHQYPTGELFHGLTYLVEIVYPENKIVVNYGQTEDLFFITAITPDGLEVHDNPIFPEVEELDHTIEEMIALKKTMPKDQEGFVVRFVNGLRVKIKGDEYLRIHKMISCMSPLSFWESMENGIVNREYVRQLPEEFRADFEPMIDELERQYIAILGEICSDAMTLPLAGTILSPLDKATLKTVGLFVQSANHGLKHPSAMFPFLLSQKKALDKYIMKHIRPTGNIFKVSGQGAE